MVPREKQEVGEGDRKPISIDKGEISPFSSKQKSLFYKRFWQCVWKTKPNLNHSTLDDMLKNGANKPKCGKFPRERERKRERESGSVQTSDLTCSS